MYLETGRQVGHFEIVALIGEGGMGEVYLARDLELGRQVALKVLPHHAADDPVRLARFEREAQVLASLNHPHVGSIFGFEKFGDVHVLILELVPGRTLAEWCASRPPVEEVLRVFLQIAEGLEAAHARGVIHRDLKPANVKITPSGAAKILDFGLADVWDSAHPDAGDTLELAVPPAIAPDSDDDSAVSAASGAGPMVGTLPYMSPEQARGLPVDNQTDIWAFGCLLFEALSGGRAFPGDSAPDVLTAILSHEPDWSRLPAGLPDRLRLLLRRCLAKDRHRRLHHTADARLEIQEVLDRAETPPRGRSRRRVWTGLAALAAVVVGALALLSFNLPRARTSPVREPVRRLEIGLSADAPLWLWYWRPVPALAVSPDGRRLVYVAERGLGAQLYLRNMGDSAALPLEDTEEARHPFFSPDGRRVAFFSETELRVLDLESRGITRLCDATPESTGGAWGDDGFLYFTPDPASPVYRVPASGGEPEPVTELDAAREERAHLWPEVLPGSATLIYNAMTDAGLTGSRLVAQSLDGGGRSVLAEGGAHARYFSGSDGGPDQIVYADTGKLLSLPFDPAGLRGVGAPRTLLEGVRTEATGAAQYAISMDGTVVYVPGAAELGDRSLVWAESDGNLEPLAAPRRNYRAPRISPDGRRIALEINDAGRYDVWIYDAERSTLSRLTFEGNNFSPLWTPDGREITFVSDSGGRFAILSKPFDDSGPARTLLTSERSLLPSSWSPDGRSLAYYERHPDRQLDILVWNEGESASRPFIASPTTELKPRFSPDGRWIAFLSDRTGRREVFMAPFPQGEPVLQISTEGGRDPAWGGRGDRLYYRRDDEIVEVALEFDSVVEVGAPRVIYELDLLTPSLGRPSWARAAASGTSQRPAGAEAFAPHTFRRPAHPEPGTGRPWRAEYRYVDAEDLLSVELIEGFRARLGSRRVVLRTDSQPGVVDSDYDIAAVSGKLLLVRGGEEQPVVDRLGVAMGLLASPATP